MSLPSVQGDQESKSKGEGGTDKRTIGRQGHGQNAIRILGRVHNFVRCHIIKLHHVIQRCREQTTTENYKHSRLDQSHAQPVSSLHRLEGNGARQKSKKRLRATEEPLMRKEMDEQVATNLVGSSVNAVMAFW